MSALLSPCQPRGLDRALWEEQTDRCHSVFSGHREPLAPCSLPPAEARALLVLASGLTSPAPACSLTPGLGEVTWPPGPPCVSRLSPQCPGPHIFPTGGQACGGRPPSHTSLSQALRQSQALASPPPRVPLTAAASPFSGGESLQVSGFSRHEGLRWTPAQSRSFHAGRTSRAVQSEPSRT